MSKERRRDCTGSAEECVLVLQGGGALGAYPAGLFQMLAERGRVADWVAGISIGAVNAALIVGNPPARRVQALDAFWRRVTTLALPHWPCPAEALSDYDTAPLRRTLEDLVDFDLLNAGRMPLSVGVVKVCTGNFSYFDTARQRLDVLYIMASGALPPGFPPVEIDGEWYWDDGLAPNTPLDYVLDQPGKGPHLVFQVDLFQAKGAHRRRRARKGYPLFQPYPAQHHPCGASPAYGRGRAQSAGAASRCLHGRSRCSRAAPGRRGPGADGGASDSSPQGIRKSVQGLRIFKVVDAASMGCRPGGHGSRPGPIQTGVPARAASRAYRCSILPAARANSCRIAAALRIRTGNL